MLSISEELQQRDGMSKQDADECVEACREELVELLEIGDIDSAMDICEEHFGLELDYVMDLI